MLSEDDDYLNGENSQFSDFTYKNATVELSCKLKEATKLLKEAVNVLNQIPNYTASQSDFRGIDHYELCSRIDKFLNENT